MIPQNGQSLWQSLFFLMATIGIGLAFPYFLPFVVIVVFFAARWILSQPERTPLDIFIGQTAISLVVVLVLFAVLALALILVNAARGYTVNSVYTFENFEPQGVPSRPFSPEVTPELPAVTPVLPDSTVPLG